jgi:S-adenosylmethionine-diacylglycerol 3-amino-3-carboxypropyl transferase
MKSSKKKHRPLLYSTCDEDSRSEARALDITEGDDVLSVTGSACRTLSLLVNNPRTVTSVDSSAGQNYLLELKLAAIRHFSYDTLLEFLGVDRSPDRWALFEELIPALSPGAVEYFTHYRRAVRRGVILAGRHEQLYVRVVAPMLRALYGPAIRELFAAPDLDRQRSTYRQRIDGVLWRSMVRHGFSERMLRRVLNDHTYNVVVDVGHCGKYVLERLDHTLTNHLVRDNDWVSFMFHGRYPDREVLPHYLRRDNVKAIRTATTRVNPVHADLTGYLRDLPDQSVDKFSLSDVTSCINHEQFAALMSEVVRTARPGAHICYRNCFARHRPGPELLDVLERDDELCAALDFDDYAFVYVFEIFSVRDKVDRSPMEGKQSHVNPRRE